VKAKLRFFNSFLNASVPNEGVVGHFRKFYHKIGCHGNVPWTIQNEYVLNEVLPYLYQSWKFGENRSRRFWDYGM